MTITYFFAIALMLFSCIFASAEAHTVFQSQIRAIPSEIAVQMRQYTWHEGCPVPLNQLVYIQLSYWGFDQQSHTGELIVNQELAKEVVAIFQVLYQNQFPIQRMELMDAFYGDDNMAMAANNTSAFNCREVTGRPGEFSQHSFGRAIDINPLLNPYVKADQILPPEGAIYRERGVPIPGQINHGDAIYKMFIKYGWDWAGDWLDLQDYQHFEKRANGEKRNPHGYEYKEK